MTASEQISKHISGLGGWRSKTMSHLRKLIRDAAPELLEEWKWNTPVWSHNGNVVAVGAFQDHVKINFFKGAALSDPQHLFNAGLDAKGSRGIDIHEGDRLNESAFRALLSAATALNGRSPAHRRSTIRKRR
jgi:hypothetical protein